MTGLKQVLYQFWSQFGVPAYLADCVPSEAVLPYITYEVIQPALNGETVLTAFAWCDREKPFGNLWRTRMMDDIETAIPVGGLMLAVDGGYIILMRNSSAFLRDWQDPNDLNVLGVRCSYIVQHYHL